MGRFSHTFLLCSSRAIIERLPWRQAAASSASRSQLREAQLINLSIGDLLFLPWEGIFTQQRHELRRHLTPPKLRCVDQVILLLSYACALKHTARLLLASRQLVQNPWSARPTLLGATGVQQPPRNAKRAQVRQRMKPPAFPILPRRDTSLSSYPPTAYSARWRRSRSGTY